MASIWYGATAQLQEQDLSITDIPWPELELPPLPESPSANQVSLHKVLQTFVTSDSKYVQSLKTIIQVFEASFEESATLSRCRAAIETVQLTYEILWKHLYFHTDLSVALKDIYGSGSVGGSFEVFARADVVDLYSRYINNFREAFNTIRDRQKASNSKRKGILSVIMQPRKLMPPNFESHMMKPIQRFPQFTLLIKDMLKFTPCAHHDRHKLQKALSDIENLAFELDEHKSTIDQHRRAKEIMAKLTQTISIDNDIFLIRKEDKMDSISQDGEDWRRTGRHRAALNEVCLLNKTLAVYQSQSVQPDQLSGSIPARQTNMHQDLRNLELTTCPEFLNNLTHDYASGALDFSHCTCEETEAVIRELWRMRHDTALLEEVITVLARLQRTYPVTEEVEATLSRLQGEIGEKHLELLQLLKNRFIFLHDKSSEDGTLAFCTNSAAVKQDWCTDFLLAKTALEPANTPSWFTDRQTDRQPALLDRQIAIESQAVGTLLRISVKCATCVNLQLENGKSAGHVWLCCSSASAGFVSLVPLHSDSQAPIQTFKVADCNLACSERVPEVDKMGNQFDTVWMSTTDRQIVVFEVNKATSNSQRRPLHTFNTGDMVFCLAYIDGKVICGTRGRILVYGRCKDDVWHEHASFELGPGCVTSVIPVSSSLWVACGKQIHVIHRRTYELMDKVQSPMELEFCHMVKVGVGVWASFRGKADIALFHSESRTFLQTLSVSMAIDEMLKECTVKVSRESYKVTALTASLGLLWVGTNTGHILTYPLPRLRAGVPMIHQRPNVALHSHMSPVRFLYPMKYDLVRGLAEHRRPVSSMYEVLAETPEDVASSQQAEGTSQQSGDISLQAEGTSQQSGDISLQAEGTSQQSGDISLQAEGTSQQSGDISLQAEGTSTQSGDISLQAEGTSQQSGDISLQVEGTSQQSGDISLQVEGTSQQSGDISLQAEGTSQQSGDISLQAEGTSQQSGDISQQAEGTSTQSGDISLQVEGTSQQSGDISQQAEGTSTQSGDISLQAEGTSQQSGDISLQVEGTSQQSGDISQQAEGTSTQSGDISLQAEGTSQQSGDISLQAEGTSQQSGDISLQAEGTSQQSGDISLQAEGTSQQSGDISLQAEGTSQQSGYISLQGGNASHQSENILQQDEGSSPQGGTTQNGDTSPQAGGILQQNGDISRQGRGTTQDVYTSQQDKVSSTQGGTMHNEDTSPQAGGTLQQNGDISLQSRGTMKGGYASQQDEGSSPQDGTMQDGDTSPHAEGTLQKNGDISLQSRSTTQDEYMPQQDEDSSPQDGTTQDGDTSQQSGGTSQVVIYTRQQQEGITHQSGGTIQDVEQVEKASEEFIESGSIVDLNVSGNQINSIYPTLMYKSVCTDQEDDDKQVNQTDPTCDTPTNEKGINSTDSVCQLEKMVNCKTILVVSCGNGYVDWKNVLYHKDSQLKHPSLLFWLYKIK